MLMMLIFFGLFVTTVVAMDRAGITTVGLGVFNIDRRATPGSTPFSPAPIRLD